jgi:hypothetical protein
MEPDFTSAPQAFAKASADARLQHLRSLTLESAASELERILDAQAELLRDGESMGLPPRLPNPLPGPTLAILLEGKPSPEDGPP